MVNSEKLHRHGRISEVGDTDKANRVKVKLKVFIWSRSIYFSMKSNYLAQIGWEKSGVKSQDFCPPVTLINIADQSFIFSTFHLHLRLEAKELICSHPTQQREHVFHLVPLVEYLEPRKGPTKGNSDALN